MDYKDLTRLCVKIAGILVIVYAATELAQAVQITLSFVRKGAPWWAYLVGAWLSPLLLVFLGLALITFPSAVVNRVVDSASLSSEKPHTSIVPQFESLGLSVLGIFFAVEAITDLARAYGESSLYVTAYGGADYPRLPSNVFADYVSAAIQFVIGVGVFLGARGLVNLRDRLRGR